MDLQCVLRIFSDVAISVVFRGKTRSRVERIKASITIGVIACE
jgi:hypothetical protein